MAGWYYLENGAQVGPVSDEELLHKTANNELQADDVVWSSGMPDWVPVSTVVDIEESSGGKAPPPAPGSKAPPPAPGAAVVPAAASAPTASEQWFYNNDGEREGPLSILELGELYKSRKLAKTDLIWSASLGDWTAASDVEALTPYKPVGLAAPPKKKSSAKKSGGTKKKKGIVIAKSKTKISTSGKSKIAGLTSTSSSTSSAVDEPAAKSTKTKIKVSPKKAAPKASTASTASTPYSPPASSADGPAMGFGGDEVDSIVITHLSRSRVWVIIMAVFNLIGAALFTAGALFSMIIGVVAAFSSGQYGALLVTIPIGLLYLGVAYLVGYPGRRLLKYASAIRRLELSEDKKDLRDAMDHQRGFWFYTAVMALIAVFAIPAFYLLVVVVGLSAGAAFR